MDTTRRSILAAMGAACFASAAPAAPTSTENPELLRLSGLTDSKRVAFVQARDAAEAVARRVDRIWPLAPSEICFFGPGSILERDIRGAGIVRTLPGRGKCKRVWQYLTPEFVERKIQHYQSEVDRCSKFKSKRGMKSAMMWRDRSKAALPLSQRYTARIERIERASGYPALRDAREAAQTALLEHVGAIMAEDARTIEGAVVQAQAIASLKELGPYVRTFIPQAEPWADRLAASFLEVAGNA